MLDQPCHLCDRLNSSGSRFCAGCGVGLVLQCGRCGTVRPGLSEVCDACGAVESDVPEVAEPAGTAHATGATGSARTPEAAGRGGSPDRSLLAAARANAGGGRLQPPAFARSGGSEPSGWGGLPVLSLDDEVAYAVARRHGPSPGLASLAEASGPSARRGVAIAAEPPTVHLRDMDRPEVWVLPDGEPLPPPPRPQDDELFAFVRTDSFLTPPGALFEPSCPQPARLGPERLGPERLGPERLAPSGLDRALPAPMQFAPTSDIDISLDVDLDLPFAAAADTPTVAREAVPASGSDAQIAARHGPAPAHPVVVEMPIAPPVEPSESMSAPAFVDHRDAKAARRAAVRRARLAAQARGVALEPMPTDLLVVDADDATRQRLCLLLDGFGFNVQSSRSTEHAVALLASRVYLAVFADVDLQDTRPDGGVEVCRLAREGGPLPDGRRPALIVMSARPSAAERVRAALAGSEHFLAKPLGRGDVARALEACDIALPTDPRGFGPPPTA